MLFQAGKGVVLINLSPQAPVLGSVQSVKVFFLFRQMILAEYVVAKVSQLVREGGGGGGDGGAADPSSVCLFEFRFFRNKAKKDVTRDEAGLTGSRSVSRF
jgi:hypothetical protein